MCGIVGFWGPGNRELLEAMAWALRHRGPDGEGFFESRRASLGHRRLAVVEPKDGLQPASNESGSVRAVLDGEVYNRRELREELVSRGHEFATGSDAELAVHAYEERGPSCFAHFNGMWALAILDLRGEKPRLVLSRDHFGIRPVYYARSGERLLFASEIKSILRDPGFRTKPDDQRIYDYLAWGLHDHGPETFFEGVRRLSAGRYAVVDDSGHTEHAYWSPELTDGGTSDPAEFRGLLERAVERRMEAGGPVGADLSGGPGSAAVARAIGDVLGRGAPEVGSTGERLQTFSVAFEGDPESGREGIELVNKAVGAEGHSVGLASGEVLEELGEVIRHQEEPVASVASYARWRLMRLASGRVTALLNGLGGDELLSGYASRRYRDLVRESLGSRIRGRLANRRELLRPEFREGKTEPDGVRDTDDPRLRLLRDLARYRLPALLRAEDRSSMAFSVESRAPFLDPELVEWVLGLPPEALVRRDGGGTALLHDGLKQLLPESVRLAGRDAEPAAAGMRWMKTHRAEVQSLFRSPMFCSRRYWDGLALADAFAAACERGEKELAFFWRAINVELWLRIFFGVASNGDDGAPAAFSDAVPERAGSFRPNPGKHLVNVGKDGEAYLRVPVRTRNVWPGDELEAVIWEGLSGLGAEPRPGDVLAVGEKTVAISQRRAVPLDKVRAGVLARVLSRFVTRTPSGIGFGLPEALELAIREAGAARILAAAAASALTRPLGIRGAFYLVAGRGVTSMDSPVPNALPPCDTHVKLAPIDPEGVSERLAGLLSKAAGGRVEAAIIDANDLGTEVLGASAGVDRALLVSLLRDNPLGQGNERTPVALIRRAEGRGSTRR